jgi:3-phosphoshikimate 1-carboxyvinyltransferase
MSQLIILKKKIKRFDKEISIPGDKSLSIRWILFSSLANGISKSKNLLISEDILAAINVVKKLGIKVILTKKFCKIYGKGINGYKYKDNMSLDAKNSGTLGRLILGLIINSTKKIKLIGDVSLSKRDFKRVTDPLSKFGAYFKMSKNNGLPLIIKGSKYLKPIKYFEKKGSAQCKSSIIFAAMRTEGKTIIKAKKSRSHTEILCKYLKLPIKVRSKKNFDLIEVNKVERISSLNYNIPSDISSASFFLALTALSNNSKLLIKNVNINPNRIGIISIFRKMGITINFRNKRIYKGEKIADIFTCSPKNIRPINCPVNLNSSAIDEFLVIFLTVAAKAKGVSYFKNLSELNQKESPRLKWAEKILKMMGIKTVTTKSSIKIFGNPNLKIDRKIVIKNYLKDHRVFMASMIAALSFENKKGWYIHDKDSIKTSFPNFLKVIERLNGEK